MTDRELLELAAKAAGIEHYGEHNAQGGLKTTGGWWNPLTDDGDALRLAVKLELDVCINTPIDREPHTHVIGFVGNSTDTIAVIEGRGDDPYAATRRAIVKAAAEIGRAMP
jgi:hypothetical protein